MKRRAFLAGTTMGLILPSMSRSHLPSSDDRDDPWTAGSGSSVLNTVDQRDVELLALRLIRSRAVRRQKEESRKRLLRDPVAAFRDGRNTLERALDELAFAAALGGANSDTGRPRITLTLAAPRRSFGTGIPGSRYLIDNPDTVYRFATVDGSSRYRIDVRARMPGPSQFSFMLHDTMFSENSRKRLADQDQPITGLRDADIVTNADGSFTVTVDGDPPNGRSNHLRTNADARVIWIRNTLNDWGTQHPHEIEISRIGGPALGDPPGEERMGELAAAILGGGTDWLLALMNRTFSHVEQPNVISKVFGRGGAWGYAARGNFLLADDEALFLVLSSVPAGSYIGFQLTDPWQMSCEYIRSSGSLNSAQAHANADGSRSYVISARDPGIVNWLDTGGLNRGGIFIRWQALSGAPDALHRAVREARRVKLDQLPALLPHSTPAVTPPMRRVLLEQRALDYAHRYRV